MTDLFFRNIHETIADFRSVRALRASSDGNEPRSVELGGATDDSDPEGDADQLRLAQLRILVRIGLTLILLAWTAFVFTRPEPSVVQKDSANMAFGAILGYWFS